LAESELLVLGAGPGGYAAAFHAADLGLSVTLVDDAVNPGGVCLYRGCIPSKALLHVAALVNEAGASAETGVAFAPPKVDLDTLRGWKDGVVRKLTGGLGTLSGARKITHVQGRGTFTGPTSLSVERAEGGTEEISFRQAIVAPGSLPSTLPFLPIGGRIMDSTAALDLPDVPKALLVVGGGYIGAELATVYAALGSKVTIVEVTGGLLPGCDRDLVRPVEARLKGALEEILLDTRVTGAEASAKKVKVAFDGPKGAKEASYDRVLVAVGRKPQTSGFGLEKAGVKLDDHGFIVVDAQRRTNVPHIFAIGDAAGQPMLAHKASHEGRVAAEAAAGRHVAYEPAAIPAVVFTDPEIAWAGLTETEAKAKGIEVAVSRFPWAASGRAVAIGRTDGLTKVIAEKGSGRVLGWGITGAGAGELIAEGVLAIEMGAVAEDVALTVHPHPTLSETLMEAAQGILGHATHYYGR